jgi:Ca2+-binding RTX toxin-like protein
MTGDSSGGILVGGIGADTIKGGPDRSILIGGQGADTVAGGSADDIVIGGYTLYDGFFTALEAILAEWQSSDSYATRVSKIKTGVAGGYKLVSGTTVLDNGAVDTLIGGLGVDWFFQGTGDKIKDLNNGGTETVN